MQSQAITFLGNLAMLGLIWGSGALPVKAATVVTLYDGSSGVTPNQYNSPNPYLGFTTIDRNNPFGTAGTQTVNTLNQSTILASSTSESFYSGYYNYQVSVNAGDLVSGGSFIHPTTFINSAFPVLDRQTGYDILFTAKMDSQTNNGINGSLRAGFNLLVLSSDKMGIEIGFRNPNTKTDPFTPDIFSQDNGNFNVIGEINNNVGGIFDNFTSYNLQVRGEQYSLFAGGTLLLKGNLRNYSVAQGFGSAVYQTPNFLFFGDNTTSAGGTTQLQSIKVTAVPWDISGSATIFGSITGIGLGIGLKRLKSKKNR